MPTINEYPRPQFERAGWTNLNGTWDYAFDFSRSGDERDWKNAREFPGKITIPFCPESKLSGVGFTDFIEIMWYRRELNIPAEWSALHSGRIRRSPVYPGGTGCVFPSFLGIQPGSVDPGGNGTADHGTDPDADGTSACGRLLLHTADGHRTGTERDLQL